MIFVTGVQLEQNQHDVPQQRPREWHRQQFVLHDSQRNVLSFTEEE